jgi:hypothetical protein
MRLPLLFFHICGGIVGLLSGTVAMVYRKGSRGHRIAGNVFVIAMLVMGACGSWLALMKHQPDNFFGGLVTFYLVATAWLTARQQEKSPTSGKTSPNGAGMLDWGALVFGLVLGGSQLALSVLVASGQVAKQPGVPIGMYFFMATITLLAATGDVRMLARGGISGSPRIARHLWRICFGLFIASGSFFLGKQEFFPAALRKQYLLFPLAILPLVMLIYWMVRSKVSKRGTIRMLRTYDASVEAAQTG